MGYISYALITQILLQSVPQITDVKKTKVVTSQNSQTSKNQNPCQNDN